MVSTILILVTQGITFISFIFKIHGYHNCIILTDGVWKSNIPQEFVLVHIGAYFLLTSKFIFALEKLCWGPALQRPFQVERSLADSSPGPRFRPYYRAIEEVWEGSNTDPITQEESELWAGGEGQFSPVCLSNTSISLWSLQSTWPNLGNFF